MDVIGSIAGLALLAAAFRPALARTEGAGAAVRCLSNHERLMEAWHRFAMDNAGVLPGNADPIAGAPPLWVSGYLDYSPNPVNTDRRRLLDGALGSYLDGDASVFKCPSDRSQVRVGARFFPRVRSVSMNGYVGTSYYGALAVPTYRLYDRLSQIVAPAPARLSVFLDEREDSINDGQFLVAMEGYDPFVPSQHRMVDFPAAYHNAAGTLSFADAHAELRRWRDRRTTPVLRPGQLLLLNVPQPNNPDIAWLQARTTARWGK